jgi:hypothetical protein
MGRERGVVLRVAELHVALLHLDQEIVRTLALAPDAVARARANSRPEVLVVRILGAPAGEAVGVANEARAIRVRERGGLSDPGLDQAQQVAVALGPELRRVRQRKLLDETTRLAQTIAEHLPGPVLGLLSAHAWLSTP